jgi:monofunctional biosynthetic peptidoglycan transglycosylase
MKPVWTIRQWLRRAVTVELVLLLAPYLLTLVYAFVPPVSTPMLWRWVTFQRVERTYVPIDRISPALALAVIIAEDGRFCGHYGIDLKEIQDAIAESDDLRDMRGASTITQQLA